MKLNSIRDVSQLKGKTVLYRVAYDVPLKHQRKNWIVADDRRIVETLPTLQYLLKHGCRVVVLTWLKRPGGRVVDKYRLDPVAKQLSKLLNQPVKKLDDCVGPKVFKAISQLEPGEVLMLENVRFYHQEEENDKRFSRLLVHGSNLIVFDAFAQAHRVHASTTGITKLLPTYAGFLVEKEIAAIEKVTKKPKKPLVVVLGGAKISDKIAALEQLITQADHVLIGGGPANVFLKAKRVKIGRSFIEDSFVDKAKRKKISSAKIAKWLLRRYAEKIVLPFDLVAANKIDQHALVEVVNLFAGDVINKRWKFLDIGPKTAEHYAAILKTARTIFWNGPMGVFEIEKFSTGTKKVARAIAKSRATSVIGGGDTEMVVEKYRLTGQFSHVSTGGGASLELLAGKELPGLQHFKKK